MNPSSGSFGTAAGAAAGLALGRLFSGRKHILASLALLLPVALSTTLAVVSRSMGQIPPKEELFDKLMSQYTLSILQFLLAIPYALALTHAEIEDGTASYLYRTRLPKWWIALSNVFVAALSLAILTTLSVIATRLAWRLSTGDPWTLLDTSISAKYSLIASIGLLVHLTFFSFCGMAFRHPIGFSLAAAIGWELLLTHLPIKFAAYTVTNNLRALMVYGIHGGDAGGLLRYVKNYEFPGYSQASLVLSILLGFWLLALAVASMNRDLAGRN